MREWNEQDGLADLGVGEAHSAGEARLLVDDHSARPHGLQLSVGSIEER
jgi:hypothetical protein